MEIMKNKICSLITALSSELNGNRGAESRGRAQILEVLSVGQEGDEAVCSLLRVAAGRAVLPM